MLELNYLYYLIIKGRIESIFKKWESIEGTKIEGLQIFSLKNGDLAISDSDHTDISVLVEESEKDVILIIRCDLRIASQMIVVFVKLKRNGHISFTSNFGASSIRDENINPGLKEIISSTRDIDNLNFSNRLIAYKCISAFLYAVHEDCDDDIFNKTIGLDNECRKLLISEMKKSLEEKPAK